MAKGASRTGKPKTVETGRTKTSISLTPEAKFKLSTLKAELRLKGHSVSESEVMEALLGATDAGAMARLLRRG